MNAQVQVASAASYDFVGKYEQDRVNGFSDEFLDRFVELIAPPEGGHFLDAMAGNGNLTLRLMRLCERKGRKLPRTTVLEFSKEQAKLAAESLRSYPVRVIWGDVISMRCLADDTEVDASQFDTVAIKSGNHELPYRVQRRAHESIFRVLKPGGALFNLGFLFDRSLERDEFGEIARVKDRLAGMEGARFSRHFLTREEYYEILGEAGFRQVEGVHVFDYEIVNSVVADQYFRGNAKLHAGIEHQVAQLRAVNLRKCGRIVFSADDSTMRLPGEVTVATKAQG